MPWYPGAVRRQITGRTNGPMRSHRGVVLHCNDANSGSLFGWIMRPNPSMSCHWQVFLDGTIEQYLDTDLSSWCQGAGNDDWLSLETSGKAGAPLTEAQMRVIPPLLAWAADVHGFPLQLADTPSGRGLGWHGMAAAVGISSWGHALCPGVRREQRPELLARALGNTDTPPAAPPVDQEDHTMQFPFKAGKRSPYPDATFVVANRVITWVPGSENDEIWKGVLDSIGHVNRLETNGRISSPLNYQTGQPIANFEDLPVVDQISALGVLVGPTPS